MANKPETKGQLKIRLHKAIFGETFGYDLEHAVTLTPGVVSIVKRLRLVARSAQATQINPTA